MVTVVEMGFKHTEAGIIPEDWNKTSLIEVCIKIQDGNYGESYPKQHEFIDFGIPFLTSKAIGKDGFLIETKIDFISSEKHIKLAKAHLKLHDVLFTNRGASVGAIGYVDERISNGNIGPQLTLLRSKKELIDSYFLFHTLKSDFVQKQIKSNDSGSAMNFFGIGETSKFKFPIPPTIEEQKSIATALSDVDELISGLEKLISKKKDIKQGAMQQLLTPPHEGGKRLPGFSGEWEKKNLGEVCDITGAGIDKKIVEGEKQVRLFNYMDVMKRDYVYNHELNHQVTAPYSKTNSCNVVEGDIFLTPSSELRTDIGISAIAMEDMEGVVYSYHVYRLRYTIEINKFYGLFMLKTKQFLDQAEKMCEGSGKRYVVSMGKFRNMTVYLPKDIKEQEAISDILYEMDAEITQLKTKKEKYQAIKQGMMQELLTGKTRLV